MAKYYGVLPSDVVNRASTFDLMVYDVSISWEKYQRDKDSGQNPEYTQEELLESMKYLKE